MNPTGAQPRSGGACSRAPILTWFVPQGRAPTLEAWSQQVALGTVGSLVGGLTTGTAGRGFEPAELRAPQTFVSLDSCLHRVFCYSDEKCSHPGPDDFKGSVGEVWSNWKIELRIYYPRGDNEKSPR